MEMNDEQLTRWKKQRTTSFVGFLIVGTIVGIDYSFMFSTLYLYLKDVIKTNRPGFYYGFIISSYCIASAISGIILGRLTDRYRRFRLLTNFVLVMQIVGISLYVIPTNVVFPIIGRTISGIGDPYTSICAGEVVRCYERKTSTSYLWWLGSCYSIGFMIGPSLVAGFTKVNFYIGPLHFNHLNSVCVLITGLLVFALILSNFLVHNCSAVYDLKANEEAKIAAVPTSTPGSFTEEKYSCGQQAAAALDEIKADKATSSSHTIKAENTSEKCTSTTSDDDDIAPVPDMKCTSTTSDEVDIAPVPDMKVVLKAIVQNADCVLLYVSTLIFVYCWFAVDVFMPLITSEVLHWSLSRLTIIFTSNGLLYLFVIIISAKLFTTDQRIYYLMLLSTISLILSFAIIFLLKYFRRDLVTSVIMMTLLVILWATGVQEVLIRCTLAKMLPSNCQSFGEAIRNGFSRISMILAGLTIPLLVRVFDKFALCVIASSFVLLVVYAMRKKSFVTVTQLDIS